ncbi:tetratricopeptide repeat protein [bacterium]|nr:tetratricopeptide repeat protein [bacterium]
MKIRLLFFVFLLIGPAWGCLNLDEQDLQGHHITNSDPFDDPDYFFSDSPGRWGEDLREVERRPITPETRNDRGVCLAHLGRAKEALAIFRQIEAESPGRYQTAANMGTCYELIGEDRLALFWIKEGIRRNPNSHQGTEWLHQSILEAKLALAKNPEWFRDHSLLGYDFGSNQAPVLPPQLASPAEQVRLRKALEYQLGERVPLVPPPDPIVGDLLFNLANLRTLDTSVQRGQVWMKFSLRYHPPALNLARRRLAYLESLAPVKPVRLQRTEPAPPWRPALAVCSLLTLLLFYQRRQGR